MLAWAGALNRVKPAATAFVHRDASWLFVVGASWSPKDTPRPGWRRICAGSTVSATRWGAYSNGQAYQNFIDPALGDWQRAYYATNIKRLVRAKRKYDPEAIFRFAQGIPPRSPCVIWSWTHNAHVVVQTDVGVEGLVPETRVRRQGPPWEPAAALPPRCAVRARLLDRRAPP